MPQENFAECEGELMLIRSRPTQETPPDQETQNTTTLTFLHNMHLAALKAFVGTPTPELWVVGKLAGPPALGLSFYFQLGAANKSPQHQAIFLRKWPGGAICTTIFHLIFFEVRSAL